MYQGGDASPARSTAVVARPVPGRGNVNGSPSRSMYRPPSGASSRCQARVAEGAGESVPHAPRSPGGPELDHEVRQLPARAARAPRPRRATGQRPQDPPRRRRAPARVRRRDGEQRGRRREDEGDDERGDRADHPPVGPVVRREGHERHDDRDVSQPLASARATRRRSPPRRRPSRAPSAARGRDHGVDERPAMEVHEVGRGGEVPREPGESGGGDEQPAPLGRGWWMPHRPQASRTQPVARSAAAEPRRRDDLGREPSAMPARASAAMNQGEHRTRYPTSAASAAPGQIALRRGSLARGCRRGDGGRRTRRDWR